MIELDATTLAREFTLLLRVWLPPEELQEIDRRNTWERKHKSQSICHSHDFCDSNQAMIDAMARCGVEYDPPNPEHISLSNAAWEIARTSGFAEKD